jgi:hypothetical protein
MLMKTSNLIFYATMCIKKKDLAKIEVENGNKSRVPKTAFIPPGHFNRLLEPGGG